MSSSGTRKGGKIRRRTEIIDRPAGSMPFMAHDLRYDLKRSYPSLCAYLQQRAQQPLRM